MGEEVFRLAATGLLAVIAVQLVFAVALLGRLNRKLESPRSAPAEAPAEPDESDSTGSAETPGQAGAAEELTPPVETSPPGADVTDGEGPYEKDGRWWYRQDDELLVYDDRTEQWVVPELHPLEDARGWDTAPVDPTPAPVSPAPVDPTPAPVDPTPTPVVATPEPASAPIPEPVEDQAPAPVVAEQTPPEPAAAPIPEPVDPPAPIAAEEEDSPQMAAHWKCPACGVINGSTATSCRMCFAARP